MMRVVGGDLGDEKAHPTEQQTWTWTQGPGSEANREAGLPEWGMLIGTKLATDNRGTATYLTAMAIALPL